MVLSFAQASLRFSCYKSGITSKLMLFLLIYICRVRKWEWRQRSSCDLTSETVQPICVCLYCEWHILTELECSSDNQSSYFDCFLYTVYVTLNSCRSSKHCIVNLTLNLNNLSESQLQIPLLMQQCWEEFNFMQISQHCSHSSLSLTN